MTRAPYLFGFVLAAGLFAAFGPVWADEPPGDPAHAHDPNDVWAIGRGGQLYDNWMLSTMGDSVKRTHLAYPEKGKKKGAATWRCKECHGWDYKGRDGAYGVGSHKTGIIGVRRVAGMEPKKIISLFMDKRHGYTERQLSHSAQEMLSHFLSHGQVDMDIYIDNDSYEAKGDKKAGAKLYQSVCATCHGYDGKEINFTSAKFPSYVGTICSHNPWEALHKIRFGQPGVGMVALTNQPIGGLVNILSYCQTLPQK